MRFLLANRSPAAANQRYRAVSCFFGFLLEQDEIRVRPCEMHTPKLPEKEVPGGA